MERAAKGFWLPKLLKRGEGFPSTGGLIKGANLIPEFLSRRQKNFEKD